MLCAGAYFHKLFKYITGFCSSFLRASLAEDWIFLALLGSIMAVVKFFIDYVAGKCFLVRMWYYFEVCSPHIVLQYFVWVALSLLFVLFAVACLVVLAPHAVGSGMAEMKTVLWGIQLKEVLTFKTGIAKVVGLTSMLSSGIPIGKEGSLVQISSVIATILSRFMSSKKRLYWNESKSNEMLVAACAVALGVNFSAPIGGVLFSMEVTSSYFATYDYWRGFVSAVFAALVNRLLDYWLKSGDTLKAVFHINFYQDLMFDPQELFVFLLIGVFGGLAGVGFVFFQRTLTLFLKRNPRVIAMKKLSPFIYPTIVSVTISTIHFPPVLGKYLMATTAGKQTMNSFFANFSWFASDLSEQDEKLVSPWRESSVGGSIFLSLGIFIIVTFCLLVLVTSLPVPNGSLFPIFGVGAAFGRMVGEAMLLWFPDRIPDGIAQEKWFSPIVPGGYSLVGAAAFTAGVTHSISICLVICEMTGHIGHIFPVMIAVLMSNAIAHLLQPSYFDSLIMAKNLPFLPNIHSSRNARESFVEDFMVRDVKYIWKGMSYCQLKSLIANCPAIQAFPLVDDPEKMILLGSVTRDELMKLVKQQINNEKRLQEAEKMQRRARIRLYEESMSHEPPRQPTMRRVSMALPIDDEEESDRPSSNSAETISGASDAETVAAASTISIFVPSSSLSESKTHLPGRSRFRVTSCPEIVVETPLDEVDEIREEVFLETENLQQDVAQIGQTHETDVNTQQEEAEESKCESSEDAPGQLLQSEAASNLTGEEVILRVGKLKHKLGPDTNMIELRSKESTKPRSNSLSAIALSSNRRNAHEPMTASVSTKPILKFNRALSESNDETVEPQYATVTGTEVERNKRRFSIDSILQKSSSVLSKGRLSLNISNLSSGRRSSVAVDMTSEEREAWEEAEFSKSIDLTHCRIDPAPFQLVERTSLLKVHAIFSLLGMSVAYVTALGKLVGVVSLKELREAVVSVKSGNSRSSVSHEANEHNFNCFRSCFSFLKRKKEVNSFHGRRITSLRLKRRKDCEADGDVTSEYDSHVTPSQQSIEVNDNTVSSCAPRDKCYVSVVYIEGSIN